MGLRRWSQSGARRPGRARARQGSRLRELELRYLRCAGAHGAAPRAEQIGRPGERSDLPGLRRIGALVVSGPARAGIVHRAPHRRGASRPAARRRAEGSTAWQPRVVPTGGSEHDPAYRLRALRQGDPHRDRQRASARRGGTPRDVRSGGRPGWPSGDLRRLRRMPCDRLAAEDLRRAGGSLALSPCRGRHDEDERSHSHRRDARQSPAAAVRHRHVHDRPERGDRRRVPGARLLRPGDERRRAAATPIRRASASRSPRATSRRTGAPPTS